MIYVSNYPSPLGNLRLTGDAQGLTGLCFAPAGEEVQIHPIFFQTCRWLDIYFSGKEPDFMPKLHLEGSPFRMGVWSLLQAIPYGKTVSYGELAKILAPRMSARAVGGAVGKNPISILVPCHRVMGTQGKLTGYAGGLDKKIALLQIEGIDTSAFSLPYKKR